MFYFLPFPILYFNPILVIAAVVPAIYLLVRVYQLDRLEKENKRMLLNMVKAGVFSSLIAWVLEKVLTNVIASQMSGNTIAYRIVLFFIVVGLSEEGAKYFELRRNSWRSPEFNCVYDGVLYAVFVSLGFALWENISYVLNYGMATAVVRAFTAIPGHACFGVYMGIFYSAAKVYTVAGDEARARMFHIAAVVVPMLIHGAYDYIATLQTQGANYLFFAFVAVLFIVSLRIIRNVSRNDAYIF